ncbi:hypothetical protein ES705_06111 [subsurface metagenome]
MINDENRFRVILRNYNIVNITELRHEKGSLFYTYERIEDSHTISFSNFILNFNRAFSIYPNIIQNVEDDPIKFSFLCETAIVRLITSIEDYLRSAFITIAEKKTMEDLFFRYGKKGFNEPGMVKKFNNSLKKLKINIKLDHNNIDLLRNVKLFSIFPPINKISFQVKETVGHAFKLLNLDLAYLFPTLWQKIFANEPSSYIKLRNIIIHSGAKGSLFGPEISLTLVESCYKDIAEFIYNIDKKLVDEFPDQTILGG